MLSLSFVKDNGAPIGIKLILGSKVVFQDLVANHKDFSNPWKHLMRKALNYKNRVYPHFKIELSPKLTDYLLQVASMTNSDVIVPTSIKGIKRSLFHKPMVLRRESSDACIKVTNDYKVIFLSLES